MTVTCHHPHRFNDLATKSEKWNGKARPECVNGRHQPSKTSVGVLPWSEGKWPSRSTSGLLVERSEVLRSLRHYLWAQSQGHHTIDRLEERGVGRGSAWWCSLKGRDRAIINQTKIGSVSKATLGKLLGRGGAHMGFSDCIYTILNWTKLNCNRLGHLRTG